MGSHPSVRFRLRTPLCSASMDAMFRSDLFALTICASKFPGHGSMLSPGSPGRHFSRDDDVLPVRDSRARVSNSISSRGHRCLSVLRFSRPTRHVDRCYARLRIPPIVTPESILLGTFIRALSVVLLSLFDRTYQSPQRVLYPYSPERVYAVSCVSTLTPGRSNRTRTTLYLAIIRMSTFPLDLSSASPVHVHLSLVLAVRVGSYVVLFASRLSFFILFAWHACMLYS